VGVVHRQRELRDRTIDAEPVSRGDVAFADALARLEVRIARLEAHNARNGPPVTMTVTHNVRPVTTVTSDRNAVTEAVTPVTEHNGRNAERQRRYRERKKQRLGTLRQAQGRL
jgi:hypothetical protein